MPRSPDRIEEELDFIGVTTPLSEPGNMTYRSDLQAWRMRDGVGEFDPRTGGGISEAQHEVLDTLAHGVVEDSYEELIYSGNRVTQVIVWTSPAKTTKIREELYTYTGSKVTQTVDIQYDAAGVELYRLTEVYTYSGNKVVDITRTRTP